MPRRPDHCQQLITRTAMLLLLLVFLATFERDELVLLVLHELDHRDGLRFAEVQVLLYRLEVALAEETRRAVQVTRLSLIQLVDLVLALID